MTTILSPQFFGPARSHLLGRLVTSVDHPHQDYHDPAYNHPPNPSVDTREQYRGTIPKTRSPGFTSAFTSLISTSLEKHAKRRVRISADFVKTYTLENSSKRFEEATSSDDTRCWLERAIDQGDDLYFIVGFTTVTKARITYEFTGSGEYRGQASLPAGLSLNVATVQAATGDLTGSQADSSHGSEAGVVEQFIVPGEQICAIQYRKIRHRWLSSKNIDKATLAKEPRWFAGDRLRDEEEGVEDILEVDTEDLDLPESEWDQQTVDGEIFTLRSH
jgi:hypothetical protein